MKRVRHRVAISVAVLLPAMFALGTSAGKAVADDYSGETYGDAASQLSDAGKTVVVSTRSGDTLPQTKCVVTHSQSAPWLKGASFKPVTNTVLLDLNCNAKVATAKDPGNSAASPQGRAAIKEAQERKAANDKGH